MRRTRARFARHHGSNPDSRGWRPRSVRAVLVAAGLVATVLLGTPSGHADRLDSARDQMRKLRADLQATTERVERNEDELEQLTASIAFDRKQLGLAKQGLDGARELLANQVAATYTSGGLSMVDAMLDPSSDRMPDRAEFVMVLLDRQTEAVRDLQTARTAYDAALADLTSNQARAKKLNVQMKAEAATLAKRFKDAQTLLGRLAGFGRGQSTYPASPLGTFGGRTYACPLEPPYVYTDTWGAPRSDGRSHKGVDILAPHGAKMFAYVDGVVTRQNYNVYGGIAMYLRGDDGNTYYYAHLARHAVPVGTRVKAGQLVAYNGQTGNARFTAPHLHFEVHVGGYPNAVPPYPWVKRVCG